MSLALHVLILNVAFSDKKVVICRLNVCVAVSQIFRAMTIQYIEMSVDTNILEKLAFYILRPVGRVCVCVCARARACVRAQNKNNKTSIKRNIRTIKQNTSGSRSG